MTDRSLRDTMFGHQPSPKFGVIHSVDAEESDASPPPGLRRRQDLYPASTLGNQSIGPSIAQIA